MVRMCLVWPDNHSILTATHLHVGRVIHEFDPWFNYRATEYMAANGWHKFQVTHCTHTRRFTLARARTRGLLVANLQITADQR